MTKLWNPTCAAEHDNSALININARTIPGFGDAGR
jgi:hypothetical protein